MQGISNITQLENYVNAIVGGRTEFDIDAIMDECFSYDFDRSEYVRSVDSASFKRIVEGHRWSDIGPLQMRKHCASIVLNFLGAGGYKGGSYAQALMRAFSQADKNNHKLLSISYPVLGEMFEHAAHPNGIDILKVFAEN